MEKLLTQRMYLILANPKLAKEVADFNIRNKEAFLWTEPFRLDDYYTKKGQRRYLKEDLREAIKMNEYRFFLQIKGDTKVIGTVSISQVMFGSVKSCFLSYKLDKDFWGNGYMAEAVKEIIDFAFRDLKLHRIEVAVMPKNQKSLAVLKRFGFMEEGYAREYLEIAGKREDHIKFALLNNRDIKKKD